MIKYSVHVSFYVFLNNFRVLINGQWVDHRNKKRPDFVTNFVDKSMLFLSALIKIKNWFKILQFFPRWFPYAPVT